MFNPTTETGKGWDGDIRDDVILEVSFYSFITEIPTSITTLKILDGEIWRRSSCLC